MKRMTIREFLDSLPPGGDLPLVGPGSCLKDVVRAMVKGHRWRRVYVIDAQGRLQGTISLDDLKDVIFRFFLEERLSEALVVSERITELFTSEKAEEMMFTDPASCFEDESLHEAVTRMIGSDVKNLPVLDRQGRVVANLTSWTS